MRAIAVILAASAMAAGALAAVHSETIEYRHGDIVLEGYLAYDSSLVGKGPLPGVLIAHEWMGLTDYEKGRANQLAELGFVAFVADVYGKGVRPQNAQEAGAQAGSFYGDRQLLRDRMNAGLQVLAQHQLSDDQRLAAIGYCFGGAAVLELARSGADVRGVVSFHGNLGTPNPADAKGIKGKVLVLHGANDPHVSEEQVDEFESSMHDAGVDWQLVEYGGAVHGFTNPKNTGDPSTGVAYNADADRRSWEHMKLFFAELFR